MDQTEKGKKKTRKSIITTKKKRREIPIPGPRNPPESDEDLAITKKVMKKRGS
jgi:hypothetical protein